MKKLVVYYSCGGNTRAVANRVAAALGADLAEIRTVKTYPDDYDVLVGLGKKEVESGYMPQLYPMQLDLSAYDAIVLGTPVWWYTYAPAVKTFMASQKWKGVHVYPFATNGGWLGRTPSELKKALRGALVEQVFSIKFDGNVMKTPESELKEWISNIR